MQAFFTQVRSVAKQLTGDFRSTSLSSHSRQICFAKEQCDHPRRLPDLNLQHTTCSRVQRQHKIGLNLVVHLLVQIRQL